MACRHLQWSELGKYFNLMSMLMMRWERARGTGETLLMACGPPALSGLGYYGWTRRTPWAGSQSLLSSLSLSLLTSPRPHESSHLVTSVSVTSQQQGRGLGLSQGSKLLPPDAYNYIPPCSLINWNKTISENVWWGVLSLGSVPEQRSSSSRQSSL